MILSCECLGRTMKAACFWDLGKAPSLAMPLLFILIFNNRRIPFGINIGKSIEKSRMSQPNIDGVKFRYLHLGFCKGAHIFSEGAFIKFI